MSSVGPESPSGGAKFIEDAASTKFMLELSTIKLIQSGDLKSFRSWYDKVTQNAPALVINDIVDTRDENIVNLKSSISTKGMTTLNYAAFFCKVDIVDFLLKKGADPAITNKKKENALHCVMESDCDDNDISKVAERLLQDRTDYIDDISSEYWTPLLEAVYLDLPKTVVMLLNKGADPKILAGGGEGDNDNIRFSLALAAINDGKVLQMLLKNSDMTSEDINKMYGSYTPLHFAVLYLQQKCVQLLVEYGADTTKKDDNGSCPIHYAGEAKDAGKFKQFISLLKKSINLKEDNNGYTLLHLMVINNKPDYVQVLTNTFHADFLIKDKKGRFPLHYLSEHPGNESLIDLLSDRFALSAFDNQGFTPLHYAVRQFDHKLIAVLLRAEARAIDVTELLPGEKCKKKKVAQNSVLHFATIAKGSDTEFVKVISAFSKNMEPSEFAKLMDKRNHEGKTALHVAIEGQMFSRVLILLDNGANPGIKTPEKDKTGGYNSIHLATIAKGTAIDFRKVIEKIQLKYKSEFKRLVDERDAARKTSLHLAIEHRRYSSVETLLEYNANPLITTPEGSNLLHLATVVAKTDGEFERVMIKVSNSFEFPHTTPGGETALNIEDVINYQDGDGKTVLHLVIKMQQWCRAETLIELKADYSIKDKEGTEGENSFQIALKYKPPRRFLLKLLGIKFDGDKPRRSVDDGNEKFGEALTHAVAKDRFDIVRDLLVKRAKIRTHILKEALVQGKCELAYILVRHAGRADLEHVLNEPIKTPKYGTDVDLPDHGATEGRDQHHSNFRKWLKKYCPYFHGKPEETTLFRELICRMPNVAKEALERCVDVDKAKKEVIFNYCFINNKDYYSDQLSPAESMLEFDSGSMGVSDKKQMIQPEPSKDMKRSAQKLSDPLQLMVDYKQTELLLHPVVGSYLFLKWNALGFGFYVMNMLMYALFLIFLCLFVLTANNPLSAVCVQVRNQSRQSTDGLSSSARCGSFSNLVATYAFATFVIVLSIYHLVKEFFWLKFSKADYFKEFQNYNEVVLYIFSIPFVFVFSKDCGCPEMWQWQIGIIAIFLAWLNMIFFAYNFPGTGVYVIMFKNIFLTFFKLTIFAFLLIAAFSLILFMMFHNPSAKISSFLDIGYSFVTVINAITRPANFDAYFGLNVAPADYVPIPYHVLNLIMWLFFLVMFPIVFRSLLISLAIGDVKNVRATAELKKLALQVKTFKSAQLLLPHLTVAKFLREIKGTHSFGYEVKKPFWKRILNKLRMFIWGGKDFLRKIEEDLYVQKLEEEYRGITTEDLADDDIEDVKKKMNMLFDLVKANEDSIKKCLENDEQVIKLLRKSN